MNNNLKKKKYSLSKINIPESNNLFPVKISYNNKYNRGVLAKKNILNGSLIEICPCIIDYDHNFNGILRDYTFKISNDKVLLAFGYGSMYNHNDDYNAEYNILEDKLYITAIKDIKEDEEIFINYGIDYWNSRNYIVKE